MFSYWHNDSPLFQVQWYFKVLIIWLSKSNHLKTWAIISSGYTYVHRIWDYST